MRRIAVVIFIMILACVVADAQSYIRRGKDVYSTPLYNWDGSCLRAGNKATADIPPRCIILTVNIFARVRKNIHSH